jgi:riboflavin synthase
MFTGIIEGMGTVREVGRGNGMKIRLEADFPLSGTRTGDSIAVNGVCLTVVRIDGRVFYADVSPETALRSTLGRARPKERVNLERAISASGRFDGHMVLGHVDDIGAVAAKSSLGNSILLTIQAPESVRRYLVEKGSIAVDGVSLTINSCLPEGFSVSIIPHTAATTTIGAKKTGDPVNIETDIIGKYVERLVSPSGGRRENNGQEKSEALTREFLVSRGFA